MRGKVLAALAAATLPACVTIEEHHLFLDPIIAADDPVTDVRGPEPVETTYAALIEETGDEAGVFGGTDLAFGGAVWVSRDPGRTTVNQYDPYEGGRQWRDVRHVMLAAPEGRRISVVRIETTADEPDKPLVVICPGTASTIDTTAIFIEFRARWYAADVVLFDYPGYGRSEGERSVAGMEAAVAAIAKEVSRPDSRPLLLWGYSLGGFACAELAARTQPDALVLDSPVRNAAEGARFFVPDWFYPVVRPFVRFDEALSRFDVVDSLEDVSVPILVIGAEKDGVLPEEGARRLHAALEAAGHEVAYVRAEGEGHFGMRSGDAVVEAVNALLDVPRGASPLAPPEEF